MADESSVRSLNTETCVPDLKNTGNSHGFRNNNNTSKFIRIVVPDTIHHLRELSGRFFRLESQENRFHIQVENDALSTDTRRFHRLFHQELLLHSALG